MAWIATFKPSIVRPSPSCLSIMCKTPLPFRQPFFIMRSGVSICREIFLGNSAPARRSRAAAFC
jgi:hypothetical protein